jgi:uncharacterized protein
MRLFLDTSSLIKLYHEEKDSEQLKSLILESAVSSVFLSDLTRIEFLSALWKKQRQGELTIEIVRQTSLLFEGDTSQYTFMPLNTDIVQSACELINKYGVEGLRSLDSIQLATAVALKGKADLFLTSDKLLESLILKERLPTSMQ